MSGKKIAIGIDLGTTYSCVGVYQNGNVDIIANDQGNRTTPSYVAFSDTERLIGDAAKNQANLNPKNTVYDAKRLIGRRFSDKCVQDDIAHFSYDVVDESDNPSIEVTINNEKKRYSPAQIGSMVLQKTRRPVCACKRAGAGSSNTLSRAIYSHLLKWILKARN